MSDAPSFEQFEPGPGSWRDWDALVPESSSDPVELGLAKADYYLSAAAEGVGRGLATARLAPDRPDGDLAADRLRDLADMQTYLEQTFPGNRRVQDILFAARSVARDF